MLRSVLVRNRELVYELAKREVLERYAGTALGSAWAFLTPMLMMGIYVGLFGFVFPSRFGGDVSPWTGAALILSGLVPWLAVADSVNRAPAIFLSNRSLVRQVVFPVEVLPAKSTVACLVPQGVGTAVGLVIAISAVGPSPMLALLPVLWCAQLGLMFGLALVLSTVGIWARDLRELVSFLTNVGLYLSPVLLLPPVMESLPRPMSWVIAANPFSHMVWCFHDVIVYRRFEHPWSWLLFPAFAGVSLGLGSRVFARLKPIMGEAL